MTGATLAVIVATALLAGCASMDVDRNLAHTQAFAKQRFGVELAWLNSDDARRHAQSELNDLLKEPLSQENATRIALAYSPAFQSLLAQNAADSARTTQSARLANPVFTFEKLVRRHGGVREVEFGRMLAFSLIDLVYLPTRMALANNEQQRLRWSAAGDVVQTLTDTRQAWVRAVAAQQVLTYFEQVMDAAEAGAELARRMQAAGNFSRLQRAREQAFYAEAAAQLARAKQANTDARESLVRTLGLTDQQAGRLQLPDRLPDLPKGVLNEKTLMQQSIDERLDVQLARLELDAVARTLGLTRIQTVIDGLHVGLINNSESGEPPQRGFEIEFPIPIFDFGDARRAGAQAEYMAAANRAQQTAIDASSQLRQNYSAYVTAHALARHYRDEIVPLRKTISDEQVLKYNGMLIGVFELLADAREQIVTVVSAIEAERDFWLADAALQATLIGKPGANAANFATTSKPASAGAAH